MAVIDSLQISNFFPDKGKRKLDLSSCNQHVLNCQKSCYHNIQEVFTSKEYLTLLFQVHCTEIK